LVAEHARETVRKDGGMTDAPTLESIAADAQDIQLAEVDVRLVADYGTGHRDTVHALLEQERHRFANARIHAFLPILIERSVRSLLAASPR
jgi:hypothetical protein